MNEITKCINEWNATIEALGQGKQTILIRNYGTNLKEFLMYPTVSYLKEDYIKSFQTMYHTFVKENATPKKEADKNEVKYFAVVEKVIEKPASRIGVLENHYIWTNEHVKSYLKTSNAYIWILRVYKLKKSVFAERTKGMRYANLFEEVSLDGIRPVLSDSNFAEIVKEIESKK